MYPSALLISFLVLTVSLCLNAKWLVYSHISFWLLAFPWSISSCALSPASLAYLGDTMKRYDIIQELMYIYLWVFVPLIMKSLASMLVAICKSICCLTLACSLAYTTLYSQVHRISHEFLSPLPPPCGAMDSLSENIIDCNSLQCVLAFMKNNQRLRKLW